MKNLLVAGDWHGNSYAAQSCFEDAERYNCDAVFQVGDFGVSFGPSRPIRFVQNASTIARKWGIPLYFIDGNHENFDVVFDWDKNGERNRDGHVEVAENVFYVPRGTIWDWDGKVFAAMGGAASIDRDWRTLGYDYFPEELISTAQTYHMLNDFDENWKQIDYFFTHDCSDRTPWGFQLVPDKESQRNRRIIDGLVDYTHPRWHFHGHMHKFYDWNNNGTKTIGLDFENQRNSRGVLHLDTDEFEIVPWKRTIDASRPQW